MTDWTQITGFQWDTGNARKSVDKHDVSQHESEQIFFNQPLLILPDTKHSQNEIRYHALGKTDQNRYLHITFTLRENSRLIRVISARDMHRKEKMIYEKA
ncbi:BrnT family toxin [Marinicella gelatinilytica]|uniref:BrnT family toxin n=1 Tax=Marinicella gelatinilytica TaxID=2996017 RepID=UPI002260D59C|nr:BrnT family toxin [Marinicella gelatinilytica]MCX7545795.1 BrnT family toxin [Marinicella gelatinilytica]